MRSRHQLRAHFLWLETLPKLHSLKNSVNSHLVYSSTGDSHTFCTVVDYSCLTTSDSACISFVAMAKTKTIPLRLPGRIVAMVRRLAADQEIYMSQWFRKAITKAAEEQYEHWGDDIDTKT